VWDLSAARLVAEFDACYDFGGKRLAISEDGTRVVAGAYLRYGLAAYAADTGRRLWHRPELKRVQHLALSPDGRLAYCGFDERSNHVLCTRTGDLQGKLRGVADVHCSPFDNVRFFDRKRTCAEVQDTAGARVGSISRLTFAFLAITFAPGLVATSESSGPVRCFDTRNAAELWRYDPPRDSHVLELGYDDRARVLQGIEWPYKRGGVMTLVRWSPEDGTVLAQVPLPPSAEYGFCDRGRLLLTWDGSLLDTATGTVRTKLAFPPTHAV